MIYWLTKRLFDISFSVFSLVLLLPVMVVIAIMVKVSSPGPVLYRGLRAGKLGQNFKILKFRTMVFNAENLGGYSTAANDPRFTPVGRFLRRYKLDELPQFLNVLVGQMSLVGPRPQVLYYTDQYEGDEKLILSVPPGITDLASLYFSDMDTVLGDVNIDSKYATEVEPLKNKLRLRYVREASFLLDVRILVETAFKLIGLSGLTGLNLEPELE
jgi:lipopolysaccharide/colanic/teichoic acid biosynthesis glycosyltransferase